MTLKPGDTVNADEIAHRLTELGYVREYKVMEPGSFSIRGDIIDIFAPHLTEAVRVNLFGSEVETLRTFNPATQMSVQDVDTFSLLPANEFALLKEIVTAENKPFLDEPSMHSAFVKFYSHFSHLAEYIQNSAPVTVWVSSELGDRYKAILEKFEKYSPHQTMAAELLFPVDMTAGCIRVINDAPLGEETITMNFEPPMEFDSGFSHFLMEIEKNILPTYDRLFMFVEYDNLARRLTQLLRKHDPQVFEQTAEIPEDVKVAVILTDLEYGFGMKTADGKRLLCLSENNISGKKRLFRKRVKQIDGFYEDAEEIQDGEYVVHLNYGIGVFRGIHRINVLGKEKDYILIHYSDGEKLYVPLEQANLIGKYIGAGKAHPHLDSLGGKSWARKRAKVQASIEEFAQKMVAIYAKRSALSGHSFASDTVWQRDFEDQFEFIETPDQVKVIEEIKRDMEIAKPMERLLCGDVGFGKTEVAMRMAFKAVMDGRQVAVIAPTTVLVEQHYYTFQKRFTGFPVKMAMVSRFTPPKELTKAIADLKQHKTDILIGTHKLFSASIQFDSLGLVIIDEEHKFGVEHKERLKERYPLVDFLTLSATPIPRTLNMALSSLRDISLLQTPPDMRIPVQTTVSDFTWEVARYAIERELDRGGQVFFVHNSIRRLPEYAHLIQKAVPNAKVTIGHGQMEEETLDEAFLGFVRGHYNVFVCTTIIDSGLDIPNANTIIISDANRYGLSQMYQLKGRVGRGKREGYAYFLYPKEKALTETAQKRLYVINEYTDLGAGFQIAMKDLEIRGAGNVLGKEQHGNILSVGYDMYMRLLKNEVKKLKNEWKEEVDTLIDLNYNAYIPDEYISEPAIKMEIYKKIIGVKNEEQIRRLIEELDDRFGTVPDSVTALFEISRLKIQAGELGVESFIEKGENIEITFSRYSKVDPNKVMQLLQTGRHPLSVKPNRMNTLYYRKFESDITIKVRRMIGFLKDIREEM